MNCHILPFAEPDAQIRLMYIDEAGFGRISDMVKCWAPQGVRPIVYRHHIREYEYAYGAVDSVNGDKFFLILPNCNTACMNVFLRELSMAFPTRRRMDSIGKEAIASYYKLQKDSQQDDNV